MKDKNQIFFLPFAGGSCFSYDFFTPHLQDFEMIPLELPGRGKRHGSPFITDMMVAAQDYTRQIVDRRNQHPYVIYGHSLGASIGAHVVGLLEALNDAPQKVIFTGEPGPEVGENKKRYLLDRDAFMEDLRKMGGMPEEFFRHPALIDHFLPVLRADFEILEGESAPKLQPFKTPIIALMGAVEEDVEHIQNWHRFSTTDCYTEVLEGGHFFIHQHVPKIASFIHATLGTTALNKRD